MCSVSHAKSLLKCYTPSCSLYAPHLSVHQRSQLLGYVLAAERKLSYAFLQQEAVENGGDLFCFQINQNEQFAAELQKISTKKTKNKKETLFKQSIKAKCPSESLADLSNVLNGRKKKFGAHQTIHPP